MQNQYAHSRRRGACFEKWPSYHVEDDGVFKTANLAEHSEDKGSLGEGNIPLGHQLKSSHALGQPEFQSWSHTEGKNAVMRALQDREK